MIGTFPKIISNYNELEGTPKNLSDFVNDLPELIEVNTYEDIPYKEGYYIFNSSIGSEYAIDIDVDVTQGNNASFLKLLDILDGTPKLLVHRKPSTNVNFLGFEDTFYEGEEGYRIGSLRMTNEAAPKDVVLSVSDRFLAPLFNDYEKINRGREVFITVEMSKLKIIDNLIITPFDWHPSTKIISSQVYIDDLLLSDIEIGNYLDNLNNRLTIKDYSGCFKNKKDGKYLKIYIEKSSGKYYPKNIVNFNTNTSENVCNLETTNEVHSNAMAVTFDEIYGTFQGNIFKSGDAILDDVLEVATSQQAVIDGGIDLLFSASPLMSVLKTRHYNSPNVIPVGSNDLIRQDITDAIDKLPPNYIVVTSRAETDNDGKDPLGTSYGFGVEFNEPTLSADLIGQGLTDWPGSKEHQQSPATAIVAAKLKKIKDETGAPWDIVREAARQTASNAGSYNIYRGFGVINVAAAIAAIPAMLDARSLELAEYFEATSKFPKELKYEDKLDNTPIVKRDIATINASNSFSGQIVSYAAESSISVITNKGWSFGDAMSVFYGILQPHKGRIIALSVFAASDSTCTISVRRNNNPDTDQVLTLNNSKSGYVLMNKPFEAGNYIQAIVESGSIGSNSRVVFWVKYD